MIFKNEVFHLYAYFLGTIIPLRNRYPVLKTGIPTQSDRNKCDKGKIMYACWDGMGREEGGGFRMGNTCIPVADSF